jgi:hypothetical protein
LEFEQRHNDEVKALEASLEHAHTELSNAQAREDTNAKKIHVLKKTLAEL